MIAVGRRSNADVLRVEKTGIEIDNHGYIKTNEQMETTKQNIWAIGDADGKYMFRHTANMEAGVAIKNIIQQAGLKMDYRSVPHAVFTHPQIASVGLTEEESRKNKIDILVGKAFYKDTAKGIAMMEDESFAKAIVAKETGAIIGFHIIGSFAATLIQEVVNAMAYGGNLEEIASGIHIHPALSEVIQRTFSNLE